MWDLSKIHVNEPSTDDAAVIAELQADGLDVTRSSNVFVERRVMPLLRRPHLLVLVACWLFPLWILRGLVRQLIRAQRAVNRFVMFRRIDAEVARLNVQIASSETPLPSRQETVPPVRSPARSRTSVRLIAGLLVAAVLAGLIAAVSTGNQANGAAPTPAPTAKPAKPTTTGKPAQPSTTKVTVKPAAMDATSAALAAQDNALPAWITSNKAANRALSRWQQLVLNASVDPRVVARTKGGQAVNEVGSYLLPGSNRFHHGQQRMIYVIMLLGSGGNAAHRGDGRYGLVPMDSHAIAATAKELGITVNVKRLTAEQSVLLAVRHANDIYAQLLDSAEMTQKYRSLANGPALVTTGGRKFTKEFLLSDLYPSMFLASWYNLVDYSTGTVSKPKGSPASPALVQASHVLYLDWDNPSSRQFSILAAQPGIKALLKQK